MIDLSKYQGLPLEKLNKSEFDAIVRGVVGIVKDTEGNLLLVLENENKAWKKKGQWSLMMETIEENETSGEALLRGLKEELGIEVNGNQIWPEHLLIPLVVYDSKTNKLILVEVEVFDVMLNSEQVEQALNFTNGEIKKVKCVNLEKIFQMKDLRPGNLEIMNAKTTTTVIKDGEYYKR